MKFACFFLCWCGFPPGVQVSPTIGDLERVLPVGMRTRCLRMDGLFWMICLVSDVCPLVLVSYWLG